MSEANSNFKRTFFALSISFLLMNTGCATIKGWFGMGEKTAEKMAPNVTTPRFSETQNLLVPSNRQYKKMTRARMEEESELHAQAGSMWVMEGQGAYLFSQNKTRREGDLLNIKIEGAAQKQVETKVSVIKKLLKQLEEEEQLRKEAEKAEKEPKLAEAPKSDEKTPAVRAPAAVNEKKKDEKEEELNIDTVPTRIVEKLPDGNYRVKGAQPFMIGKREYKVIVTGLIRSEDFNDDGISSNRLLDPQFDVVSLRKKEAVQ